METNFRVRFFFCLGGILRENYDVRVTKEERLDYS